MMGSYADRRKTPPLEKVHIPSLCKRPPTSLGRSWVEKENRLP